MTSSSRKNQLLAYFYLLSEEGGLLFRENLVWVRLNESAAFVLSHFVKGGSTEQIISEVQSRFQISSVLANEAVMEVSKMLKTLGLSIEGIFSVQTGATSSHADAVAMCAKQEIKNSSYLQLQMASASMTPILAKGRLIRIVNEPPKRGDILCFTQEGSFVVHRVLRSYDQNSVVTRGDYETDLEEVVRNERYVGIVSEFRLANYWIPTKSLIGSLLVSINPFLSRVLYLQMVLRSVGLSIVFYLQSFLGKEIFRGIFLVGAKSILSDVRKKFNRPVFVSGSFSRGDYEFGSSDLDCFLCVNEIRVPLVHEINKYVHCQRIVFPFFRAICLVTNSSLAFIRKNLGVRGYEIREFGTETSTSITQELDTLELSCIRELAASVGFLSYSFARLESREKSIFNSELPRGYWTRSIAKHLVELLRYVTYLHIDDAQKIGVLAAKSHTDFLREFGNLSELPDALSLMAVSVEKLWKRNRAITLGIQSELISDVSKLLSLANRTIVWGRWSSNVSSVTEKRIAPCSVSSSWQRCFDDFDPNALVVMRLSQNVHQFFQESRKLDSDLVRSGIYKGLFARALFDLGESLGGRKSNLNEMSLRMFLFDAFLNNESAGLSYRQLENNVSREFSELYSECKDFEPLNFEKFPFEAFATFVNSLTERVFAR